MRRYVLAAVAALLVLSLLALVLHDPKDGTTGVAAGGDPADTTDTTDPDDAGQSTTTTTSPDSTATTQATTPTAPAAGPTTTTAPKPTTTTTLPPPKYPKGPASPLASDKVFVVSVADSVPHDVATGVLDLPTWSTDGRRILVAGGTGPNGIRSMNPDGSGVKGHSLPKAIVTPAWSAKGQLAAVTYDGGTNAYDLGVSQPNGSVKSIKQGQVGPVSGQAWSPDGARLAFIGGGRVWVANADTGGVKPLTAATTKAWRRLAWSPDGTRIAFYGGKSLQVVNADGTGHRTLAPAAETLVAWSPDSKRIAFTGPQSADYPLTIVDAAGAAPAQPVPGVPKASSPAWSPDGSTIAYTPDGHTVDLVKPDGSGKRRLLGPTEAFFGYGLAWSPDGTHLLVNTGGGGEGGPSEPQ